VARATDLYTLALVLWREARSESYDCREAVAGVVMERVRRGCRDVTDACTRRWQFSSLTDPRDHQLTLWPQTIDHAWQECLEIADAALAGRLHNPMPGADHYIDVSLAVPPLWATSDSFVGRMGRLLFYAVADAVPPSTEGRA